MDDTEFRVEPADYAADLNDLRAVREPVFVIEQNVPLALEWDELDPLSHHVIARDAERRPIGTGRLTPEHKIGRMAVLKPWRGRGVGDALLQALIDKARQLGWREVTLNAQVSAAGFYEKFGFAVCGGEYEEAGIQHVPMRASFPAIESTQRPPALPRGPSAKPVDFDDADGARDATKQLIAKARRQLWIYSRDLERDLYADKTVVEALKQFAISGRGGVVQIVVQDVPAVQSQPHPLLELAQRLSSAFEFRTPDDPVDMQYPSAFLVNDADGYLFRVLGSRFEGEWSPALPARNRQLVEGFDRVWQRCRPCTEFRALGI